MSTRARRHIHYPEEEGPWDETHWHHCPGRFDSPRSSLAEKGGRLWLSRRKIETPDCAKAVSDTANALAQEAADCDVVVVCIGNNMEQHHGHGQLQGSRHPDLVAEGSPTPQKVLARRCRLFRPRPRQRLARALSRAAPSILGIMTASAWPRSRRPPSWSARRDQNNVRAYGVTVLAIRAGGSACRAR